MKKIEEFHRLPLGIPEENIPSDSLIVELSVSFVGNQLVFFLSDGVDYLGRSRVDDLVSKYVSNTLGQGSAVVTKKDRIKALGIPVRGPRHVLVALKGPTEWRFRANGPAITAQEDYGESNYGSWHFTDGGVQLDELEPGPGCKIACMTVVERKYLERQKFNLHLEFLQDKRWLQVIIDPDIPETGPDGFPFIGPTPSPE